MSAFLKVLEDEWVASNSLAFAIRDRFAVSPGHTLVITRRLIGTWWDATPGEQAALLELVDQVKRDLDLSHRPDGYNVGFNAGEAAGQTIDHLHIHVIPRFHGDMPDPRGGIRHAIPGKGNYLATEEAPPATDDRNQLVTPLDGRMHRELSRRLNATEFDRVDLLISFVMRSGVNLIAARIDDALARGARIRLLSTDYLMVTDVGALGFFLDRLGEHPSGGSLEARVFSDPSVSFHPKAYIFSAAHSGHGVALVGSSNLSHSGIRTGIEWNLRSHRIDELTAEFNQLWQDQRALPLTAEWLEQYRAKKALVASLPSHPVDSPAAEEPEPPIAPWSVQHEALAALEATRLDGHRAGLVVMATGLGKTWLAAFDSTRPSVRRTLFVAHREEILRSARDVYRRIRPGGELTMFVGDEQDLSGDVVFASIQSLQRNLHRIASDAFDYIVVDEFHHAAAPTYRRAIGHFTPAFLLGLTATPDRTDAADLLSLCDDNLVYECGLTKGLDRGLLSPFRYRAIKDVADYAEIPWRSGRFDTEALTSRLETQQRAEQVVREWQALGGRGRRALAFCCSISHADFMARYFADRGIQAVSVHTGRSSADRFESLDALEDGDIDVVFSVDLFNEGVDLPGVDIVMMLRPTESPIVFFQQLGRGLRRIDGKSHLDVLDLVGNHRSFLLKARLLAALAGHTHLTDREAVSVLQEPLDDLPDGCSVVVDVEALDLLSRLLGTPKREDRLAELAGTWADDHEGARPRALELTLLTNRPHDVKRLGGWFGFLRSLGMLNDLEQETYEIASEFLIDIEHGNYTKSFKLVTLRALIDLGTMLSGSRLSEVALDSRWQVHRDPRLLADLSDATSQFTDVLQPTEAEWLSYWMKNPINALAGSSTSTRKWFKVVDGQLLIDLEVPERSAPAFVEMVTEIVEYRLHRYLMSRDAKRVGERCQPFATGGRLIDAAFSIESVLGQPISILFESAGGSGPGGKTRNPEYVEGIDVVLARLGQLGATVLDAYVDSGRTQDLPVPDRRLSPDTDPFPIDLRRCDLVGLRRQFLRKMSKVGRAPSAGGGGNSRKAMRILLGGLEHIDPGTVASALTGRDSAGAAIDASSAEPAADTA